MLAIAACLEKTQATAEHAVLSVIAQKTYAITERLTLIIATPVVQ